MGIKEPVKAKKEEAKKATVSSSGIRKPVGVTAPVKSTV